MKANKATTTTTTATATATATVTDESVAASTATVICRSLGEYLTSEAALAKQLQTLLGAYGGDIERAGALVGRTWRAETAKSGLVIPIRFLVNALQQAGLTIKSARLFAGACDLVSRQAIHKACASAYYVEPVKGGDDKGGEGDKGDDKGGEGDKPTRTAFDKLLASLAKLENLTQEQADLLSAAIATKLQ